LKTHLTVTDVLKRWVWLAVPLICAIALHVTLEKKADTLAQKYGPEYVPITEVEARKRAVIDCESSLHRKIRGETCGEITERQVEYQLEQDKYHFDRDTIAPLARQIKNGAAIAFSIIYAAIILTALWVFFKWLVPLARRVLGRGMASVSESSLDVPGLRRMNASRTLRKAEDDFRTLKSLHENGLITAEMFDKGKRDLKATLDNNEMFRK
jgi:hypothetical protein